MGQRGGGKGGLRGRGGRAGGVRGRRKLCGVRSEIGAAELGPCVWHAGRQTTEGGVMLDSGARRKLTNEGEAM